MVRAEFDGTPVRQAFDRLKAPPPPVELYDLENDPENCGACGNVCGIDDVCTMGICEPICPAGQTLCGETCYDLLGDPDNCGTCGNQCAADEYCQQDSMIEPGRCKDLPEACDEELRVFCAAVIGEE